MSTTTQPSIRDRLSSDAFKHAIAEVLPEHVTPERMARTALTAITRTPELAKCDQASFFKCMMDLSQWGLEPDGRNAHLIPFRNNKKGIVECQLIIDYKGLVQLAYNTGKVESIHADVVHVGDVFDYSMGVARNHVPHFLRTDEERPAEEGDVIAAYCVVTLKGGVTKCEVMSKEAVESIRSRSRAGRAGPWQTDWCEMAKKTAFRRVSKWIPLSAELRDAFERPADMALTGPAAKRLASQATKDVMQRLIESQDAASEPEVIHVDMRPQHPVVGQAYRIADDPNTHTYLGGNVWSSTLLHWGEGIGGAE